MIVIPSHYENFNISCSVELLEGYGERGGMKEGEGKIRDILKALFIYNLYLFVLVLRGPEMLQNG